MFFFTAKSPLHPDPSLSLSTIRLSHIVFRTFFLLLESRSLFFPPLWSLIAGFYRIILTCGIWINQSPLFFLLIIFIHPFYPSSILSSRFILLFVGSNVVGLTSNFPFFASLSKPKGFFPVHYTHISIPMSCKRTHALQHSIHSFLLSRSLFIEPIFALYHSLPAPYRPY